MLEGAPRAEAVHKDLWKLISPHLVGAIVGTCEIVKRDSSIIKLEDFVSVYVPVIDRVFLRGRKKYAVCKHCGSVKCVDIDTTMYLIRDELAQRRAVMSTRRGILVDDAIRDRIAAEKFRSVGFYKYEVLDEPLDGRPRSLDDWPQLVKWRQPKKKRQ